MTSTVLAGLLLRLFARAQHDCAASIAQKHRIAQSSHRSTHSD